jgi:hypothetical protein
MQIRVAKEDFVLPVSGHLVCHAGGAKSAALSLSAEFQIDARS